MRVWVLKIVVWGEDYQVKKQQILGLYEEDYPIMKTIEKNFQSLFATVINKKQGLKKNQCDISCTNSYNTKYAKFINKEGGVMVRALLHKVRKT